MSERPSMDVELLYFDDCPNWEEADDLLARVAHERGDITIVRRLVLDDAEARRLGFHGSPSIHLDGVDLFEPLEGTQPGLSCRVYATPDGFAGTPSLEELHRALADRLAARESP